MSIVTVNNLSKHYGDFVAVKDVSFTLERGEIFGFLGPNGAGKTTTINMLTGLARATNGGIEISGVDCVKDMKRAQRKIGIVPDESNLYEEMDGFDNLVFCASLYGIDKKTREHRAKELLELFGLSETKRRLFKAYSKGMKRKLTIAAGIIHEPEILFLDEPTTGIDVESARQIRKLILELNAKGTTIFLTTHYIEEAERLCHRIGFIVKGEIVRIDTVSEMMQKAQTENIIQFTMGARITSYLEQLSKQFPGVVIEPINDLTVRIHSTDQVNLMPFMKFFDDNNCVVHEARIIKPSLEEVFVKVTGIGLHQMKNEKEGRRRK